MDILVVGLFVFLLQAESVRLEDPVCGKNIYLKFYCADGKKCIDRKNFCDGTPECSDHSDEASYNSTIHSPDGMQDCVFKRSTLTNNTCYLPKRYMCDHELDCVGGKDECGCSSTFQCKNNDCALRVLFCNGRKDCSDGSDEETWTRGSEGFQCQVTKKHVTTSCSLPDVHVCDGASDCQWGTDECFCETPGNATNAFSNDKCFRCLDGTLVIPNHQVCDGKIHCQDLSDECLCLEKEMKNYTKLLCDNVCTGDGCPCPGELQCHKRTEEGRSGEKICVKPTEICDEKYDCTNGFDEDFCALDGEYFTCDDRSKRVRKNVICDGVADCADKSDEFRCHENMFVCNPYTLPRFNWTHLIGWNNTEDFPPLNRTTVEPDWLRIGQPVSWTFYFPYYSKPCDGIPLCPDGEDECKTKKARDPKCDTRPGFCDFVNMNLTCPNSESQITGYEVCDGQPTCNDTHPETSIDEIGCPGRFYCENRGATRLPIHIPQENECDLIAQCDDQSDERNCQIYHTHYYCKGTDNREFVSMSRTCDGREDCKKGDDECQNCSEGDPFSSDDKLIANRVLVAFLWVIGSFSTLGNTFIIIHQLTNIYKIRNNKNQVALKNRILVLNLSCADLLMGVYLIALGIKDATIDRYCLYDQEWRSSATCSSLGVIAVIGTEASVMILIIMTSHRLHLVFKPFETQSMAAILVSLIFAWVVAIILATAPLPASAMEYFLSCVWFPTHRYFGHVCKANITKFTQKLVALEGKNKTFSSIVGSEYTWKSMLEAQTALNETYVPKRYYGYYSAHGVCLPKFYPNKEDDTSWGYSMFLVLLNFFAFVYILLSYIFIYKRSTSNQISSKKEDRAAILQRKVSRIVLTDFCCWMPICIMAFLKVGGVEIGPTAYAATAIILLPINSAMNPLIYSSLLDVIWDHLRPVRERLGDSVVGKSLASVNGRHKRNGNRESVGRTRNKQHQSRTCLLLSAEANRLAKEAQVRRLDLNRVTTKSSSTQLLRTFAETNTNGMARNNRRYS